MRRDLRQSQAYRNHRVARLTLTQRIVIAPDLPCRVRRRGPSRRSAKGQADGRSETLRWGIRHEYAATVFERDSLFCCRLISGLGRTSGEEKPVEIARSPTAAAISQKSHAAPAIKASSDCSTEDKAAL